MTQKEVGWRGLHGAHATNSLDFLTRKETLMTLTASEWKNIVFDSDNVCIIAMYGQYTHKFLIPADKLSDYNLDAIDGVEGGRQDIDVRIGDDVRSLFKRLGLMETMVNDFNDEDFDELVEHGIDIRDADLVKYRDPPKPFLVSRVVVITWSF